MPVADAYAMAGRTDMQLPRCTLLVETPGKKDGSLESCTIPLSLEMLA